MHFDFEYTIEDLREVHKITRKHPPRAGLTQIPYWTVYILLGIFAFFVLYWRSGWRYRLVPALLESSAREAPLGLLMIATGVGIIAFRHFRMRWPSSSLLKKNSAYQKQVSLDLDEAGLQCSDGASHTRWEWHGFDRMVETEQRFWLRVTDSVRWIMIPKRAVRDPADSERVRTLLKSRVLDVPAAFPVIAIANSDSLADDPREANTSISNSKA
jgi:hypothetical protein